MNFRKADDSERRIIALQLANAFAREFSVFSKNVEKVANVLSISMDISRFYVAVDENDEIVGTIAYSDCYGRAIHADLTGCREILGFFKGTHAKESLTNAFGVTLEVPITTCQLEFLTVKPDFQQKGIARAMLQACFDHTDYQEFTAEVQNTNRVMVTCLKQMGFEEYHRVREKNGAKKGFDFRLYFRHCTGPQKVAGTITYAPY